MTRPPAATMFFGHPVILLLAGAGLLWTGYSWVMGEGEGLAAFMFLVLCSACAKANDRYENYRQWKREWDIMSGKAARARLRLGALRLPAAIATWCLFAAFALQWMNDPELRWAALLFWAATGIGTIGRLWSWLTRTSRGRSRNAPVTVCLRVPGRSPGVGQAQAALPDYCRELLARR